MQSSTTQQLTMVSSTDKTFPTQGSSYTERHKRLMREVSTARRGQEAFYRRTKQADLYRISALTVRQVQGTKRVLVRTCSMKGPLGEGTSQRASTYVAQQTLSQLAKYANKYSKPFCAVCLAPAHQSSRVVQIAMDSWFTGAKTCDPGRARIWVAFRVCSDQCGKNATVFGK